MQKKRRDTVPYDRFTPVALRLWWNPLWILELIIGFTFRHLEGASWFAWAGAGLLLYIGYEWERWQGVAVMVLPIFAFIVFAKLGRWAIPLVTIATIVVIAVIHFKLLH